MRYSKSFSGSGRRTPARILAAGLVGLILLLGACTGREVGAEGLKAAGAGQVQVPNSVPIHPSFSFSEAEFGELVAALPQAIQHQILARPTAFLDQLAHLAAEPEELTWLVDKTHPAPDDYVPPDLVELDAYSDQLDLSRDGHVLREIVIPDLLAMVEAARADGITLLISSAYRSYEYQAQLYQYWVEQLGQEEADRVSARPGTSQHQLGTAVDFGCICDEFAGTEAGRWIASNAWKYGSSLSYPDGYEDLTGYAYESWHFRYIGKVAARMEREFFAGIQQHLTEFVDGNAGAFWSFLIEI
ncbi:MAG: M15 family metallopeptidase [Spirochaetaceae bacterium]|nr:M15 family metallopeptidase [Spirochaetaceae bacterium]